MCISFDLFLCVRVCLLLFRWQDVLPVEVKLSAGLEGDAISQAVTRKHYIVDSGIFPSCHCDDSCKHVTFDGW